MHDPPNLAAFLADLKAPEPVPKPEREAWVAMIDRIRVVGRVCEIDVATYEWFLECLPPQWLGHGFALAEGAEPLKLFWMKGYRCFVRQLTEGETRTFCRLARIPNPC